MTFITSVRIRNWSFSNSLIFSSVTDEVFTRKSVVLSVAGLDTIAKVFINGVHVGSSDNMFHTHEWDIKSLAKVSLKCLRIAYRSNYGFFSTLVLLKETSPKITNRRFSQDTLKYWLPVFKVL